MRRGSSYKKLTKGDSTRGRRDRQLRPGHKCTTRRALLLGRAMTAQDRFFVSNPASCASQKEQLQRFFGAILVFGELVSTVTARSARCDDEGSFAAARSDLASCFQWRSRLQSHIAHDFERSLRVNEPMHCRHSRQRPEPEPSAQTAPCRRLDHGRSTESARYNRNWSHGHCHTGRLLARLLVKYRGAAGLSLDFTAAKPPLSWREQSGSVQTSLGFDDQVGEQILDVPARFGELTQLGTPRPGRLLQVKGGAGKLQHEVLDDELLRLAKRSGDVFLLLV